MAAKARRGQDVEKVRVNVAWLGHLGTEKGTFGRQILRKQSRVM